MVYRLHTDGASRGNPGPAGIGVVIRSPEGKVLREISAYVGVTTNNVAEYRALLEGLRACQREGWGPVEVVADSELLIRQLEGRYKVRNDGLKPLHREALVLLSEVGCAGLRHVYREENADADRLANRALDEHLKSR